MEPNIWGPSAWTFLHTIALQYPELPTDDDKKQYYIFFNSLKDVLPCPNCRMHYSEHLGVFISVMSSYGSFVSDLILTSLVMSKARSPLLCTRKRTTFGDLQAFWYGICEGNFQPCDISSLRIWNISSQAHAARKRNPR